MKKKSQKRGRKKEEKLPYREVEDAIKLYFAYRYSQPTWKFLFEGDYQEFRNRLEDYPRSAFPNKLDGEVIEEIVNTTNKTA